MTEFEALDLDSLATAIADRLSKKAPLRDTLWSSKDCADYFRVSVRHFANRMACHHKFPDAIRFPTKEGKRTHPRWYATEVIKWGRSYR